MILCISYIAINDPLYFLYSHQWSFVFLREDFFSVILLISAIFLLIFFFFKVTEHGQIRSKIDLLKQGADVFSYFSLIFSYFIFYSESSLFSGIILLNLEKNALKWRKKIPHFQSVYQRQEDILSRLIP